MNAPEAIIEKFQLKDGREVSIETGRLAKQANGSVVVKCGGTMLLATVVANKDANPGVDFLPLTVDYREKFYAGGKIPGNFFRRETKPSDDEVLTMRLVDRVLRPLFPKDFHAEVEPFAKIYYHDVEKEAMRQMILNEGIRLDGRDPKTIRPIWSEIDYLPGAHGSAIFTRGETQSLTAVTLGSVKDANMVDSGPAGRCL